MQGGRIGHTPVLLHALNSLFAHSCAAPCLVYAGQSHSTHLCCSMPGMVLATCSKALCMTSGLNSTLVRPVRLRQQQICQCTHQNASSVRQSCQSKAAYMHLADLAGMHIHVARTDAHCQNACTLAGMTHVAGDSRFLKEKNVAEGSGPAGTCACCEGQGFCLQAQILSVHSKDRFGLSCA